MKTALLLVDIQNDFLSGGSLAIKNSDDLLPFIYKLLELPFDYFIASKDFHPINHISFAKTHKKQPGEIIPLHSGTQILWEEHCVQNTPGANFPKGFPEEKIDEIFYKGTDPLIDSYSTFFDNAHEASTGLYDFLKGKDITDLFFVGLATDYCVKYSVLDALELKFNVFVIEQGCRAVNLNPLDEKNALLLMEERGAHIISEKKLLNLMGTKSFVN